MLANVLLYILHDYSCSIFRLENTRNSDVLTETVNVVERDSTALPPKEVCVESQGAITSSFENCNLDDSNSFTVVNATLSDLSDVSTYDSANDSNNIEQSCASRVSSSVDPLKNANSFDDDVLKLGFELSKFAFCSKEDDVDIFTECRLNETYPFRNSSASARKVFNFNEDKMDIRLPSDLPFVSNDCSEVSSLYHFVCVSILMKTSSR